MNAAVMDAAGKEETTLRARPRAELEVKMEASYIFDMLLYHMYSTFGGFMLNIAGLTVIIMGGMRYYISHVPLSAAAGIMLFGVILLAATPLNLKLRASRTMKLPKYQSPIRYGFDGSGIDEYINGSMNHYGWSRILKAVSTPKTITFYLDDESSVLIFPKAAFDNETFKDVMWHLSHNVVMGRIYIR